MLNLVFIAKRLSIGSKDIRNLGSSFSFNVNVHTHTHTIRPHRIIGVSNLAYKECHRSLFLQNQLKWTLCVLDWQDTITKCECGRPENDRWKVKTSEKEREREQNTQKRLYDKTEDATSPVAFAFNQLFYLLGCCSACLYCEITVPACLRLSMLGPSLYKIQM